MGDCMRNKPGDMPKHISEILWQRSDKFQDGDKFCINIRWPAKPGSLSWLNDGYNVLNFEAPSEIECFDALIDAYEAAWSVEEMKLPDGAHYYLKIHDEGMPDCFCYNSREAAVDAIQAARAEIEDYCAKHEYDVHETCDEYPCESCTQDRAASAFDAWKYDTHGEGK